MNPEQVKPKTIKFVFAASFLELMLNNDYVVPYKVFVIFFVSIINSRWPPSQDKFNIGSFGKNISKLLSETTEPFVNEPG